MDPIAQPHESKLVADPAAPITPVSRPLPSPHILHLAWKSNAPGAPAVDFAVSLASHLFDVCREVVAESRAGEIVDDLDLGELALAIRNAEIKMLRFRTGRAELSDEWRLDLTPSDATTSASCRLTVTVCPNEQLWTQVQWLQASFDHPSPIPLLAVPHSAAGVSMAVFHGLVVLAARFAPLNRAELRHIGTDNPTETVARWWFDDPPDHAVPVIAHENETLWLATKAPPPAATEPACWVEVVGSDRPVAGKAIVAPAEDWQARLSSLLSSSPPDDADLAAHLQALAPAPVPFRVCPLHAAPTLESMSPQQDGVVCVLVPTESAVHIGIDFEQAADRVRQALVHAYGHLLLGHVQPGDVYGHWDTADTLSAEYPHRRWDREVREHLAAWLQPTAVRKVTSLDDCTPLEKAQLGLWRMIGEMLGESRRLHPLAERYQKAVYQRQAAQRMVAMLEDYGGAMLCDGVGLGKTYVATTLIVHDVNTWKDRHAADPDRVRTDPFRITVLSPNSVVSTWRREAIPTLSAFGVPLATIRVVSHTRLSRLTRTSELLQRSARDTLSDLEHLLLSDLVIVDEAHNFRSVAALRTRVLRDLLRLQPRREARRRVVLLTATPVNNSLEDLRQEAGLLFSRPLWLSDARTDEGYRRQAVREVQDRCARALLSLLHMRGALSELRLEHPSLPFVGIIDLVRLGKDGVTVVDFKTGEPKDVHRQQVALYAVLWWRRTGQLPSAVEARYPGHVASFSVSLDDLLSAEEALGARINELTDLLVNPPAIAHPGEQCRYCDVRQFCDVYWDNTLQELPARQASRVAQPSIDIELTVCGQPCVTGFEAQSRSGRSCTVVHSADSRKMHGPFTAGETLRILNARLAENESTFELMPWTEVFHR